MFLYRDERPKFQFSFLPRFFLVRTCVIHLLLAVCLAGHPKRRRGPDRPIASRVHAHGGGLQRGGRGCHPVAHQAGACVCCCVLLCAAVCASCPSLRVFVPLIPSCWLDCTSSRLVCVCESRLETRGLVVAVYVFFFSGLFFSCLTLFLSGRKYPPPGNLWYFCHAKTTALPHCLVSYVLAI